MTLAVSGTISAAAVNTELASYEARFAASGAVVSLSTQQVSAASVTTGTALAERAVYFVVEQPTRVYGVRVQAVNPATARDVSAFLMEMTDGGSDDSEVATGLEARAFQFDMTAASSATTTASQTYNDPDAEIFILRPGVRYRFHAKSNSAGTITEIHAALVLESRTARR